MHLNKNNYYPQGRQEQRASVLQGQQPPRKSLLNLQQQQQIQTNPQNSKSPELSAVQQRIKALEQIKQQNQTNNIRSHTPSFVSAKPQPVPQTIIQNQQQQDISHQQAKGTVKDLIAQEETKTLPKEVPKSPIKKVEQPVLVPAQKPKVVQAQHQPIHHVKEPHNNNHVTDQPLKNQDIKPVDQKFGGNASKQQQHPPKLAVNEPQQQKQQQQQQPKEVQKQQPAAFKAQTTEALKRQSITPDPRIASTKLINKFDPDFLKTLSNQVGSGVLKPKSQTVSVGSGGVSQNILSNNSEVIYEAKKDKNVIQQNLSEIIFAPKPHSKTTPNGLIETNQIQHVDRASANAKKQHARTKQIGDL